MASAVVKTSKSHGPWQSWNIYGLSPHPFVQNASLGAGLDGSAISGLVILPQYCKIPKVAVAFGAIDVFDGSETFNIVVEAAGDGTPAGNSIGVGASYTPGAIQTTGYPDNSLTYGYPSQPATAGGPVFFATGDCLFANDVAFDVANFPLGTTSGGGAVLRTTNYDGVFAAGTVLSLRAVTTASTGSVANLCITLFYEPLDDKISDDNAVPITDW